MPRGGGGDKTPLIGFRWVVVTNQVRVGAGQHPLGMLRLGHLTPAHVGFEDLGDIRKLNYSFHSMLRLASGFIGDHFLDNVSGVTAIVVRCTNLKV